MEDKIEKIIRDLRLYFQDCNLNFLIGSGASRPFLKTLGNIEKLLTQLEQRNDIEQDKKRIIEFIIYRNYFDIAMEGNLELLKQKESNGELKTTLDAYKEFIKTINQIILKRGSSILNKQVNLFTTNIDIFLEKTLETVNVEFNDGFYGRLNPVFNLNQYKKLRYNTSYFQDKLSESPVFNLFKIHGSINWYKEEESIYYDKNLGLIKSLKELIESLKDIAISDVFTYKIEDNKDTIDTLLELPCINRIKENTEQVDKFFEIYKKLQIINPTKQKFKDTILKQIYYDILRIYANELEKENTALFVFGFSFADEHIRSITVRALNYNPTLTMIVFAYTKEAKEDIENEINKSGPKNENIIYVEPNEEEDIEYNLTTITKKFFSQILNEGNRWE